MSQSSLGWGAGLARLLGLGALLDDLALLLLEHGSGGGVLLGLGLGHGEDDSHVGGSADGGRSTVDGRVASNRKLDETGLRASRRAGGLLSSRAVGGHLDLRRSGGAASANGQGVEREHDDCGCLDDGELMD